MNLYAIFVIAIFMPLVVGFTVMVVFGSCGFYVPPPNWVLPPKLPRNYRNSRD